MEPLYSNGILISFRRKCIIYATNDQLTFLEHKIVILPNQSTCDLGIQKNFLIKTVFLSTENINKKNDFPLPILYLEAGRWMK